ncbi:isochorismatase family protein [Paenibacillus whitsoniae]|uniref:isochorismatase n=1 Tax=Paenibacillus whitsoniae TaxID=2496558 RepID=A0A3S0A1G6_9BACL|nr:isochorismatase family protein [Paenibacillus whitsoniae]RTE06429.1 isochorismatase family protein [Paenibacillus whitsoniae]
MALPTIQSYSMPVAADLPANRASWTPDPQRAVLLVHDMQAYFLNAYDTQRAPIPTLVAHIKALLEQCRKLGVPVVYTAQPGEQSRDERGLLFDFWGEGINKAPHLKNILPELAPAEGDTVLDKWRYSAFRKSNLADLMKAQGRDQLIITGIYAHIGCMMTAAEAFMQDIQAFMVADALADFSLENHAMAIAYAANRCAVVLTTAQVQGHLGAGAESGVGVGFEAGSGAKTGAAVGTADCAHFHVDTLREQVAKLLYEAPESLGDDDHLIDAHGLDSIRVMSLVEAWRQQGAEVTFAQLAEQPTLASWSELLQAKTKEGAHA